MEKATGMISRIGIIGPEASGKTELTKQLAEYYKEPWVPEFARAYLESNNGFYEKKELDYIAKKQLESEENRIKEASRFLFCDTTPLVVKVWSNYKYGSCSEEILQSVKQSNYALQLLLKPDIEYSNDPLRENPSIEDRNELFLIYKKELERSKANYAIVEGLRENRVKNAINILQQHFYS